MMACLRQETLSTHSSSPRNVIYSHFFAKKRYQLAGSVITFLCREIVRPITGIKIISGNECTKDQDGTRVDVYRRDHTFNRFLCLLCCCEPHINNFLSCLLQSNEHVYVSSTLVL